MREIVLDTETTGLDPETGDRIVEIGAVELLNHVPTGRTFHAYLNPQRAMPLEAFEVHGLGADLLDEPRPAGPSQITLRDKPLFADVASEFLTFVADARLVIHNAEFDMRFLNAELRWAGRSPLAADRAVDTIAIVRRRFPGAPASLDALCRRFGIDNAARKLHGALLDSEILADVYLELIGGRQPGLAFAGATAARSGASPGPTDAWRSGPRPRPLAARITEAEAAAHAAFVAAMGPAALWAR